MAIYKETKDYKLIHDNMLNMGDYIPDGTIDCIITDPPYYDEVKVQMTQPLSVPNTALF